MEYIRRTVEYAIVIDGPYSIDNKKGMILDSIKVYGINDIGIWREQVDFALYKQSGKILIFPVGNYGKYMLTAEAVLDDSNNITAKPLADTRAEWRPEYV